MFTIIENYKTLMKMCVSAELAPTEHVVAAVEAEAADGSNSFTLQDLNKVVADLNASHPGADHESQVLAVLKNKFDVNLGWEVLNKMNNLSNQATQVEAQGQVGQAIHAQEVQQAVPNANSMATMPTNYETLQTAMPVYTTEQFIAPSVDTFNGQRVTQLNYLSQPIDGSQLVIGNYYRSEINEIMEYRGGCFTVKSGPVVLPGIST